MSTTRNDGGPAFPRPVSTDEHDSPCNVAPEQGGMTLRDWFAGQALVGLVGTIGGVREGDERCDYATAAYAYADAMLLERDRIDGESDG